MSGAVIATLAILNIPKTSNLSPISLPSWLGGDGHKLSRATPEELAKYMKERDKFDAEIQRKYEKKYGKKAAVAPVVAAPPPAPSAPLAIEEDNPTTALMEDIKPKID